MEHDLTFMTNITSFILTRKFHFGDKHISNLKIISSVEIPIVDISLGFYYSFFLLLKVCLEGRQS